jgi:hypothetical protein
MHKKKLSSQVVQPVNKLPVQNTPIKLVELSDEALSQVCGGGKTTGNPGAKYISSLN